MPSSTTVVVSTLFAILAVAEAGQRRVGREADFHIPGPEAASENTVDVVATVVEPLKVVDESVTEEEADVEVTTEEEDEEEDGEMMGIAELTNALNEDFSKAPMFVYIFIGIVVAIGVGVPALAVMRWRSSRRALSDKESLSLIRHAHTMAPTGYMTTPNSPKYVPQWSPSRGGSPYATMPSTPAGSNTSQQMTMRARTPNRVEERPPSPNRHFLSQMHTGVVGAVVAAPPSPGRDIDV